MEKFRKKPVVIEAVQYDGNYRSLDSISFPVASQWLTGNDEKGNYVIIPTLEGDHKARPGDWIIKGVAGEYYPCKPEIFEATYIKEDPINYIKNQISNLDFGKALIALKNGHKIARTGWNGRGMFVVYSPGNSALPAEQFFSDALKEEAKNNNGYLAVRPALMLRTAQNDVAYWSPSTSDCLAEDWYVVNFVEK